MHQEAQRLTAASTRTAHWRRWGPYLSERQWGTVRENYSPYGTTWDFFPHGHDRSRTYRWGEDGLAGISDNHQRLCFALALWNGHDAILKERLFGLTGSEGNHGEDVKEYYFYLDSTPMHSYMKYLWAYFLCRQARCRNIKSRGPSADSRVDARPDGKHSLDFWLTSCKHACSKGALESADDLALWRPPDALGQFHVLSFEGPDPSTQAGGIASRITGLTRALAETECRRFCSHACSAWRMGPWQRG